jgi:CHASE2 domain-containing sensor protein
LLEPRDGSDTFLTIPAETLLQGPNETGGQLARAGLKGKIVIVGGTFPDIDRHLTPLSAPTGELQPGALIHAHMVAELVDKRHIGQLETDSLAMKLELMVLAGLAFLVGWRTRMRGQGLFFGTVATVAIIAVDTFVFWYWRIILPVVLALIAWFLGEFTGNHIGRWLGSRTDRSRWLVR